MHVLRRSCGTTAPLDIRTEQISGLRSPIPVQLDVVARTFATKTPITLWTVTNHPVTEIQFPKQALHYSKDPNKLAFCLFVGVFLTGILTMSATAFNYMCVENAKKRTEMQYTHEQHRHGNSCTTFSYASTFSTSLPTTAQRSN